MVQDGEMRRSEAEFSDLINRGMSAAVFMVAGAGFGWRARCALGRVRFARPASCLVVKQTGD